jgi:hypothetical protein
MRRPHLGGALGAALLQAAIKRKWVTQDLDSRALALTAVGRKEFSSRFALELPIQETTAQPAAIANRRRAIVSPAA